VAADCDAVVVERVSVNTTFIGSVDETSRRWIAEQDDFG
jgi:hypothetical protein